MANFKLVLKDQFGNVRTLQDNVEITPSQPLDTPIWINTIYDPPTLNVLVNGEYFALVRTGAIKIEDLNIPTTRTFVKADLKTSLILAVDTDMFAGLEIHVIVENTSTSKITITIPNGDKYVNLCEDTLDVDSKGFAEINLLSDGEKIYIRTV